jgi:hypothetical protein
VGCGGAGGALALACRAVEAADDGGQGCGGGPVKAIEQRKEEGNSRCVRGKRSRGTSWSMVQDQERVR